MEMASAIARKSQSAETDNGAQYISFTDLGPAIDSVDANTNACTGPWLFGSRCVFGIPTFILALFIVITCRFCWRKFKCLFGCMSWCCRSSKKMDNSSHPATTPSSPTCEAVDMEAAIYVVCSLYVTLLLPPEHLNSLFSVCLFSVCGQIVSISFISFHFIHFNF